VERRDRSGLLSIGEFARLSQVSVKALRHYHDRGLLLPAAVDPATGYRCYRPDQLRDAAAIVALRRVGMPLHDIGLLLASDDPADVRALLAEHRRRLAAELADAEHRLVLIQALITKEIDTMYDIAVLDAPATRVVSERLDVPSRVSAVTEAATLAGLATRLMQRGIEPSAQPILVIHHADEQRVCEDACLPVPDDAELEPELSVEVLPGGRMATATHIGPLDELVFVVHAVMGWIAGAGHAVGAPFRVQLLSIPPLFTVASAGGGDQPVAQVFVPFD
jgi:DNA-binding transcriptional MerR regulator